MSVFVLDSNILSFYLRQNRQIIKKVQDTITAGNEVLIGPIAYYEVKRGLLAVRAEKRLKEFAALCKVFGVGQLDNSFLDFAADIYRDLKDKFEVISGLSYCDWIPS